MAPIKSAWEVALENTKNIEGSKETLAAGTARDEGRKLAAKALDDPSFGLKDALKSVALERIALVREGLIQSLLTGIMPTGWENAIAFALLILILYFRPQGLLGTTMSEGEM